MNIGERPQCSTSRYGPRGGERGAYPIGTRWARNGIDVPRASTRVATRITAFLGFESFLKFRIWNHIVGAGFCSLCSGQGLTLNTILRIGLALGIFLLPALPAEAAGARKFCEAEVRERLDLLKLDPGSVAGSGLVSFLGGSYFFGMDYVTPMSCCRSFLSMSCMSC